MGLVRRSHNWPANNRASGQFHLSRIRCLVKPSLSRMHPSLQPFFHHERSCQLQHRGEMTDRFRLFPSFVVKVPDVTTSKHLMFPVFVCWNRRCSSWQRMTQMVNFFPVLAFELWSANKAVPIAWIVDRVKVWFPRIPVNSFGFPFFWCRGTFPANWSARNDGLVIVVVIQIISLTRHMTSVTNLCCCITKTIVLLLFVIFFGHCIKIVKNSTSVGGVGGSSSTAASAISSERCTISPVIRPKSRW